MSSSINDDDISMLLKQWNETKEVMSELELKMEKYKRLANRIMYMKDTNVLSDDKFTLKRKELSRETLSKKDLPIEIWNKYSNKVKYNAYYLKDSMKK